MYQMDCEEASDILFSRFKGCTRGVPYINIYYIIISTNRSYIWYLLTNAVCSGSQSPSSPESVSPGSTGGVTVGQVLGRFLMGDESQHDTICRFNTCIIDDMDLIYVTFHKTIGASNLYGRPDALRCDFEIAWLKFGLPCWDLFGMAST